jgi:hypothetical protein
MNAITKLFNGITSSGEITIVQQGFLYSDRVDTRTNKLVLKDFVTLLRYFLKNKYLEIRFEIQGKENANNVLIELKKLGVSTDVLKNKESWLGIETYEVDVLLNINLPKDKIQDLIKSFYVLVDAALVYPVGYMSWDSYFKQKNSTNHL